MATPPPPRIESRLSLVPEFKVSRDSVDLTSHFFSGFSIEKPLSDIEATLVSLTEKAAKRHGFDTLISFLGGIPEEVLRRLVKLKAEAKRSGIDGRTFHDFLEFMLYCRKISLYQPQWKGFINDILIAGNTIALRVQDLFNGGEIHTKDGKRLNGIFGKQGIVKREKDLQIIDDLMPFLYVIHMCISKGYPFPAYMLFFSETPNPVPNSNQLRVGGRLYLEYNSGPWFNANLVLERCQKFLDEATSMSLDVTPDGLILVDSNNQPHFLPVICAIYDLDSMTMWRVERWKGHIYAQILHEWLDQHKDADVYPGMAMFPRKDIVTKHIERLTSHSNHGSEHMQMRVNSRKKVGCVDGRQDNSKSEIGCLIGEKQLENLLQDNNTTDVMLSFHTECGYIITAITLHKIFRALKLSIDPQDTLTMGRVQLFIELLAKRPWISRDQQVFEELMKHVDLSKASSDRARQDHLYLQLHDFFTDNQGSLRYATSHMLDRRVFEIENGFPVMTSARHVEDAILKYKLSIPDELIVILTIEELVRLDMKFKVEWIKQHAESIASQRINHKCPQVEWVIEDFITGRYYQVRQQPISSQSAEQILDFIRSDSMTETKFDLAGPRLQALSASTNSLEATPAIEVVNTFA